MRHLFSRRLIGIAATGIVVLVLWMAASPGDVLLVETGKMTWTPAGLVVNTHIRNRSSKSMTYYLGSVQVTSDRDPGIELIYTGDRHLHRLAPWGEEQKLVTIPARQPLPDGLRLHLTRFREANWVDAALHWLSVKAPSVETRRWLLARIRPTAVKVVSPPFTPPPFPSAT